LTGTFAGALEARGIPATREYLKSDATGEVETEDKVLIIRRIHVLYRLRLPSDKCEAALRAHSVHIGNCPIARSIRGSIAITTELQMEEEGGET
jgi:organic hydroperoxide reductase OsmC/OhrA